MGKVSVWVIVACLYPADASVFAGRAVEDHSGNPLPRAEIRITQPRTAGIVAEIETGADGSFRTPDLPDADYVLRFSRFNYATVEVTSHARSGMLLRMVRFGATGFCGTCGGSITWILILSASAAAAEPIFICSRRPSSSL